MAENIKKTETDLLDALLNVEDIPEKDVFMKRFGANFKIRAIDGDTLNRITEQATYRKTVKGEVKKEVNENEFGSLIIKEGCVTPNWQDKRLLDKYNTIDPKDVIRKRLLAGEIASLSAEIMELSGFGDDVDGEIENF